MSVEQSQPIHACHLPCPDLVVIDSCEKKREEKRLNGLSQIAALRTQIKTNELSKLKNQRESLIERGTKSENPLEQTRLRRELREVNLSASRLSERWS